MNYTAAVYGPVGTTYRNLRSVYLCKFWVAAASCYIPKYGYALETLFYIFYF